MDSINLKQAKSKSYTREYLNEDGSNEFACK